MKRKSTSQNNSLAKRPKYITNDFINECSKSFHQDPINLVSRNAVLMVGAENACINPDVAKKASHIFLNTIKTKEEHATDQGSSGRCWMFSGLNIFRHLVNKALNLKNFEFSQTYLFFWDKFERCNLVLQLFVETPDFDINSRLGEELVSDDKLLCDGGFWSTFAGLVDKYGLVPKCAMNETWHSIDSGPMNSILYERLFACCNKLSTIKDVKDREHLKWTTMQQLYSVLVKFLGEPPKTFTWSYTNDDEESNIINNLTPHTFKEMILVDIQLSDFVVLSSVDMKEMPFYQKYVVNDSKTMLDGEELSFINLPSAELKKYAMKSILSGSPVWFAGDVGNGLSHIHGTLDEELFDTELFFGDYPKFDKGDRIKFRKTSANHAMTLVGFNCSNNGKPDRWQVENSWGDQGHDGYLSMSNKWFDDNLINVVIHKNYLSRAILKLNNQEAKELNLWDFMAPAMRVVSYKK